MPALTPALPDRLSLSLVAGIAEQVAFEHFIENPDQGETADGHDSTNDYSGLMEKSDYVAQYPDAVHEVHK
jgi:hypothetical protein